MKDHWSVLGYWVKHGGPHLVWIFGAWMLLYSAGIVDAPAWSKDVRKVKEKVTSIEMNVTENSKKLNNIAIENAAAKERDKAQQRQLNTINSKLDTIIKRLLTPSRP